jgi:hypothetical protein
MSGQTTPLAPPLADRNETELERADRHLIELLQEVRVAQTGVQVLFGFLLTVPFTVRFDRLSSDQRALYFATLVAAGVAAILLIAPTAQHRVLFRCGDKEHVVKMANRYAIAGLTFVALAIVGAMTLLADVIYGGPFAIVVGASAAGAALWCWYLQPARRRAQLFRVNGMTPASPIRGRARPRSVAAADDGRR